MPEVRALGDALKGVIAGQFGNAADYTKVYLEGRRGKVRTEETNLGNLSADANLWYASVFSKAHVVLLDVTAAELKDILEHGAAGTAPGAAPGQFPQIAGMRVGYDPSGRPRAAGEDAQRAA